MGLINLLLVIFIIVIFVTRIRIVPQANVYVVERLGAFYKAWGTGINFLVPFIDRVAKRVSIKEQVVDFTPQAVISSPSITVSVGFPSQTEPTTKTSLGERWRRL